MPATESRRRCISPLGAMVGVNDLRGLSWRAQWPRSWSRAATPSRSRRPSPLGTACAPVETFADAAGRLDGLRTLPGSNTRTSPKRARDRGAHAQYRLQGDLGIQVAAERIGAEGGDRQRRLRRRAARRQFHRLQRHQGRRHGTTRAAVDLSGRKIRVTAIALGRSDRVRRAI